MPKMPRTGTTHSLLLIYLGLLSPLLAAPCQGFAFSAKKKTAELDSSSPYVASLRAVLDEGITGFKTEPPEQQEWLRTQARTYARVARGLAKRDEKEKFKAACEGQSFNPFCTTQAVLDDAKAENRTPRLPRLGHKKIMAIRKLVQQGELEKLRLEEERGVRAALVRFPEFAPLEKSVAKAMESTSCEDTRVAFLLAEKVEQFFPDPELQEKASQLYEKVTACSESPMIDPARYRLSLIEIWRGQCKKAAPHLAELAHNENKDYHLRSLFWQAECAQRLGETARYEKAKTALATLYPFSLHYLLTRKKAGDHEERIPEAHESKVLMRSKKQETLNRILAAAEALISINETRTAGFLAPALFDASRGTEPEVQLYVGALLNMTGSNIEKFRLLSALFQEQPQIVSRSALELLYPRRELPVEIIESAGLDQFLVLALVRQESAFNEKARSRAGAVGLMQVMPSTARLFGVPLRKRRHLYHPDTNVKVGSRYFAELIRRYEGDTELALAAYNAGPLRVNEWLKRYPVEQRPLFIDLIPFKETREYVASITRNFYWYNLLYGEHNNRTTASQETRKPEKTKYAFKLLGWASGPSYENP